MSASLSVCLSVSLSAGKQADLVLVFFDPMGQALCKRTLNIVEQLSDAVGDKLHFYLSKADEAGNETDRQVHTARNGSNIMSDRYTQRVIYQILCLTGTHNV